MSAYVFKQYCQWLVFRWFISKKISYKLLLCILSNIKSINNPPISYKCYCLILFIVLPLDCTVVKPLYIVHPNYTITLKMKKLIFTAYLLLLFFNSYSQCNTNTSPGNSSATGCVCKDGSQQCDLLPDLKIGTPPFYDSGTFGIIEYAQSGNIDPADNGKLKVTVSTPNIGHGALEIHATQIFVCDTDTFFGTPPAQCANGTFPRILINQRIYHKNNNTMSFYDVPAGTMTYHPTHGHMHVDDWGTYTLRTATSNPDPMTWPIVGAGAKLAFCVMDYGTCDDYPNHCQNDQGITLNNIDFPNFGLGGGIFACDPQVQGISSGFTDIYWTSLEGMHVNIPPCLPNGTYWLVCKLDPNNNFIEENENNNVFAIQYTLTKQDGVASINNLGNTPYLCPGNSVVLSASDNGSSYMWSSGQTTQNISVNLPGVYTVSYTSACGNTSTASYNLQALSLATPAVNNVNLPVPGTATLTANGQHVIKWYDDAMATNLVHVGNTFTTPFLNNNTAYYAADVFLAPGQSGFVGPANNTVGASALNNSNQRYLVFSAYKPCKINFVTAYAGNPGNRTIELRDANGNVLQSKTFSLTTGANLLNLDFTVNPGVNYQLGLSATSIADLHRNSSGITYPYQLNNLLDITGSSAGSAYYYFFYNWQVSEPDFECSSPLAVGQVTIGPVGINDFDFERTIQVFPNPTNNMVQVAFAVNEFTEAKIIVSDITGKQVYSYSNNQKAGVFNHHLNLSKLLAGVYQLSIYVNNKPYHQKLIKY